MGLPVLQPAALHIPSSGCPELALPLQILPCHVWATLDMHKTRCCCDSSCLECAQQIRLNGGQQAHAHNVLLQLRCSWDGAHFPKFLLQAQTML